MLLTDYYWLGHVLLTDHYGLGHVYASNLITVIVSRWHRSSWVRSRVRDVTDGRSRYLAELVRAWPAVDKRR